MASINTAEFRKRISVILNGADLNTLSSKKVRKQLEEHFDIDLTERKKEIDDLLMEMISQRESSSQNNDGSDSDASKNNAKNNVSSDEDSPPPVKKQKTKPKKEKAKSTKNNDAENKNNSNSEIDDEALARQLQEQERRGSRRSTVKSRKTRETKKDKEPKKRKGESAYTRKCHLSEGLAEIVGADEMARPEVVKKMWAIARERNLFDPSNKQFIICDQQLQKVLGLKRLKMFGLMKYLKSHIKDKKNDS